MAEGGWVGSIEVRTRRCTILFADLVESVRMMAADELSAIRRWRAYVHWASSDVLPRHRGRLVRTAGDGLLVEFEHPKQAVEAALELHRGAAVECEDSDADAMQLRIGVHHGEVVFDAHEAYGAGVNLSQRLATLAPPGGTVISAAARSELVDGLDARLDDLGERYVKHLDAPVRAFAVREHDAAANLPSPPKDFRPVIAVIPFTCTSLDPQHDAIGHALADDIIATLAHHPELAVLSRMSTASLRDTQVGPTRVRELTGAAFALSGRLLVRGQRVRVSAELSELQGGTVLWTGTHHADIDALFEGQDDIVPHLVSQVTRQVLAHELARVRSLPTDTLDSYSLFLGAHGLLHSLAQTDFGRAHEALTHLADRHPRQAALQAMLSDWHFLRALQGWSQDRDSEVLRLCDHARRAVELDPENPDALVAEGRACILAKRDFDQAQRHYERALANHPQHPMAWARLSETQRIAGHKEEARESARRALALSPLDPQRFIYESFAGSAALDAGLFAEAATHARASLRLHRMFAPPHRVLVTALWLAGEAAAAREAASAALCTLPWLTVSGRIERGAGHQPIDTEYGRAQLAAGIPP